MSILINKDTKVIVQGITAVLDYSIQNKRLNMEQTSLAV